jgi:hypothetical protein
MNNDFAVFILTNGRPHNQKTYKSLQRANYTGQVFFLVDTKDPTGLEYVGNFGHKVIFFDKDEIAKTFDQGDNFQDQRAIIYARNACFQAAQDLGIKYFIQLDDDYVGFYFRFDEKHQFILREGQVKNIEKVFEALLKFYKNTPCHSIALSQNGDFIGGKEGTFAQGLRLRRKCMNSFVCSTERPFQFVGRINEDVNTYTYKASTGHLFFTTNQVSLKQTATQKNAGGMTELYLDSGTYVKSFYSIMFQPSSVKIKLLNSAHARLHHFVSWKNTTPKILSEQYKKGA